MSFAIAFWVLAAVSVVSALAVVASRNIFRAALLLGLSFLGVAGLYVLLNADFVAAVQVLIYIGAVSILIILAVMLTRDVTTGSPSNKYRAPAAVLSILVLAALLYAFFGSTWKTTDSQNYPAGWGTTADLATQFFGPQGYILPIEIVAVLLLVAAIGAIVLAREKEEK